MDRVLSYIACLRRSPSLFFIPLEPYPARSARHLPHAGKAVSVGIVFPHMRVFVLTMREKRYSRVVVFPIGEGGPRQRRSGALVYPRLETIPLALFHTASTLFGSLRSPPSPRGEGFISGIVVLSYRSLPHWGRGDRVSGARVLSFILDLRRISPLIFHTARTLSGSLRSPPSPRGEGIISGIALFSYRCPSHTGRAKKERRFAPIHICSEAAAKSLKAGIRD